LGEAGLKVVVTGGVDETGLAQTVVDSERRRVPLQVARFSDVRLWYGLVSRTGNSLKP
jgi:hypothetical protein